MVQSVLAAVNYGVELQRIQQSDYKRFSSASL